MDYRLISMLTTIVVLSIILIIGSKEKTHPSDYGSNDIYLNQKKFAITRCLYKVLEFDNESIKKEGSSGMYVQMSNDPVESFEKINNYVNELYRNNDFYYPSKHGNSLKLGRCIDFIDDKKFEEFLREINN